MRELILLNGFIYLKGFAEEEVPGWVTNDDESSKHFFLLNKLTREYFRNDLYPLYRSGSLKINDDLYQMIREYPKTDYQVNGIRKHSLIMPAGITLKAHQEAAVNIAIENKRFAFFFGPGTGKTLIVITLLINLGMPKNGVLVVTPKRVIGQYIEECQKYLGATKITDKISEFGPKTVLVTNYEQLENVRCIHPDWLIVDESHRAKNYMSVTNRNLRVFSLDVDRVYLFTGTPQDKHRDEVFPQLAILNERYMPGKTRFYQRYFYLDDYHEPTTEIMARSNELTSMLNEISWGLPTEKAISLTEEVEIIAPCPHPGDIYTALAKDRVAYFSDGTAIVAGGKAELKMKLRELCSGHVFTTNKESVVTSREKTRVLFEELAKIPKDDQTIIYTEFKEDIDLIIEGMSKRGFTYASIDGATTSKSADGIIRLFKDRRYDYLIIQNRSGSSGLDLSNANHIIFYTLPESYIAFYQAKCRIRRIGQTKTCYYHYLLCTGTVEEDIFRSLKKKKSFSTKLFKIYE